MKSKLILLFTMLICIITVFSACSIDGLVVNPTSKSEVDSNEFIHPSLPSTSLDITIKKVTAQQLADVEAAKEADEEKNYINLKEVLKRLVKSVVKVDVTKKDDTLASGSGVVIGTTKVGETTNLNSTSETSVSTSTSQSSSSTSTSAITISYIITCHRFIENAESVQITTSDGTVYEKTALIGSDPESGICVIGVEASLEPAEFYLDSDKLEVGENLVAIGNPLGTAGGTVTRGIVSSTSGEITYNGIKRKLIQTDAAINQGNSGGALFTDTGFFVGMVDANFATMFPTVSGIGFAVPSNEVQTISTELVKTKTEKQPGFVTGKYVLGCTVQTVYENRWGTQTNAEISELNASGSIAKAGLQVGDVINYVLYNDVTYNMSKASDFTDFVKANQFKVGDKLKFNITRSGTVSNREVTILQYIYGVS